MASSTLLHEQRRRGPLQAPWVEQGEAASSEHTLLWPPVLQKPHLFEVKAGWLELLQQSLQCP